MDNLSRSIMTINCRDCDDIPKVIDAGRIVDHAGSAIQIMHNGLRVVAGGYYGDWMSHIIRALDGHHEPQEELIFHTLLRYVRHDSLFVELGAFWAYYSLWYLKSIPCSSAICIEPDPGHVGIGRRNAELNGLTSRTTFVEAWVGGEAKISVEFGCETTGAPRALPMLDMGSVLDLADNRTIEILHMDIQGLELPFIRSMARAIAERRVRFIVVSTHHRIISGSGTTHQDCLAAIVSLGGYVLVEHDIQQSFSGDGLIVASFLDQDRHLVLPEISRNEAHKSLFPTP